MKSLLVSIGSFLLIASILSSCSNNSSLTSSSIIKKRKYTKGFYLDLKKNKYSTGQRAENFKSTEGMKPRSAQVSRSSEPVFTASARENVSEMDTQAKSQGTTKKDKKLITRSKASATAASKNSFSSDLKNNLNISSRAFSKMQAAPAAEGSTLIYVILAILIPPLAVGLLYGISTEFWISLLLTILFILPGVIYSIIKVLDY